MFHKILFNFYKTNIHHIQCTITNVFIYSFTGLLDDKNTILNQFRAHDNLKH